MSRSRWIRHTSSRSSHPSPEETVAGELLPGLDMRPHPGAQPVVVGAEFNGQVQPGAQFRRRINDRVTEYLALDEGPRRQIVVPVMDIVGDLGDDMRLQNEIQKLVRRLWVRRGRRNEKGAVRDVRTLFGQSKRQVR